MTTDPGGGCELRPFGHSVVNVLLSAAGHMQYWRLLWAASQKTYASISAAAYSLVSGLWARVT